MDTKKVEELECKVRTLELVVKQLENQVNRLLSAHGDNVPIPAGAPKIRHLYDNS